MVCVTTIYDIGPFRLDAEAGVLTKAGVPMALGSRAVAVLTTLVKQPNEYVTKASIIDAAWRGIVVEESNLAVQISSIRRVFAEHPEATCWIETLSRRGYRFVGSVTEVQDDAWRQKPGIPRSNLPAPLTSFIGRERELVEIKRLLPHSRLLTIVGVGGIGKTRLALQLAAEVMDAYLDGVWLVELGSIGDPMLVPTSVAQVLGVQERAGTPLADTLRTYLKSRQLLLVLDNCEHLLDACVDLVGAILREAGQSAIVATSREHLRVAGEQTYPLQTLSLPDPAASAEALGRSEAVQLLVDRARLQQPDFALTSTNATAIAQLCIHLDGIPLALELAAARTRSLTIEQISARLHDRFGLLTGGSRTALPRQQTLRATLDWSYGLLAEQERVALRRLAIFAGGFSLEAASGVVSDPAIDEAAVIDLVAQLVTRSLVVADTIAGRRYRLLETTRAYALERLVEAEEIDAIRRKHAKYYRDRFEPAYDDWLRVPDRDWRTIYLPELDNVRAALDWAHGASGDTAVAIGLASASGPMWAALSLHCEGLQRLEIAVAQVATHTSVNDLARLWSWIGMLTITDPAKAAIAHEQAVGTYRGLDDPLGLGVALALLGCMLAVTGRCEDAEPIFEEALPLVERSGVPKALGLYFNYLGVLKSLTGNLASARLHYEKALSLCRRAGAEREVLRIAGNIAELAWVLGDLDAAAAAFRETLALLREKPLVTRSTLGFNLLNLAGVMTERGELDEALTCAREGLPLLMDGAYAWVFMDHLALRAALAGNVANAARLDGYADSLFAAKASPRQPNEARAHARLQALLREELASDDLERMRAEGSGMNEAEACRLALEEDPDAARRSS